MASALLKTSYDDYRTAKRMREIGHTLQLGARIDQSSRSFQAVDEDDVIPCISDRAQLVE